MQYDSLVLENERRSDRAAERQLHASEGDQTEDQRLWVSLVCVKSVDGTSSICIPRITSLGTEVLNGQSKDMSRVCQIE